MKNEIIKFSITDLAIKELVTKYQNMKIIDAQSYKMVTAGIGEMRSIRVSVENRRLEYGRGLKKLKAGADGEAKRITELLLPTEIELKATKQAVDDKKEAIKAEKDRLEQNRIEVIKAKITAFPPETSMLPQLLKMPAFEIRAMQDVLAAVEIDIEVYQEFTPEAIRTKEEKKNLLQEYYIARITSDAEEKKRQTELKAKAERQEQVRIEQERLESERLAKVEAQRIIDEKAKKEREIEAKRQEDALKKQEKEQEAKQKIEDNRLAKIREAQEAEARKLRDAQAEIDAQKKAIQEEQDRIDREKAEQIRLEQEKQAQIERNKIAKIEAKEQERARIEAVAADKKRQEEMRPDKENLLVYLDTLSENINSTVDPVIKTSEGKAALSFIQTSIEKVFVDTLKIIGEM